MEIVFTKGRLARTVKVGYSWTVAFFGPITFAVRGQWGMAIFTGILNLITYGLAGFVIAALANRSTARWLVENGWEPDEGQDMPADWEIAK